MASFKIEFENLDLFKKALSKENALRKLVPDISISILKFHNALNDRVKDLYNAPGELDSVRIGHSVAPAELGKTFLRYSLQYRNKPIPLAQYPHIERAVSSDTAVWPKRLSDGFIKWTHKGYAIETQVAVRKGRMKAVRKYGKTIQDGFLQKDRIFARKQPGTWKIFPSKNIIGVRAPFTQLYGPSLMTLASATYDKDQTIARAKETLELEILEAMVRSYSA